ncbi:unnamed protein product [Darwinula stevensoni]|uniref:Cytochrome P450 n=1 Tax=Darwinula stevensoni TaxID=69355 RepID=A0A7R9ABE6_9CRUS|nr:unnamed protein product [Darwinula stevensoni]CAG0899099.1 unnamed protein product [Darwinula stevensoni]
MELWTLLLGAVLLLVLYAWMNHPSRDGLPPGPTGWPLVGSVHLIINKHPYKVFHELSKKYGKIFSIQMGSYRIVVLNDLDSITQAYARQGDVFSHRPKGPLVSKVLQNKGTEPFSHHFLSPTTFDFPFLSVSHGKVSEVHVRIASYFYDGGEDMSLVTFGKKLKFCICDNCPETHLEQTVSSNWLETHAVDVKQLSRNPSQAERAHLLAGKPLLLARDNCLETPPGDSLP